jgi:uncharacterized DUF497 family protein
LIENGLRVNIVPRFWKSIALRNSLLAVTFPDPDHSSGEDRHITFGMSRPGRLLVVSHVDLTNGTRIISARLMTRQERTIYEED